MENFNQSINPLIKSDLLGILFHKSIDLNEKLPMCQTLHYKAINKFVFKL